MEHRVITDGVSYRAQTRDCIGGKWRTELRVKLNKFVHRPRFVPVEFRSYGAATKYLQKLYGTKASIRRRKWVAA